MARLLSALFLIVLALTARAETTWLGVYLQGKKIGYSRFEVKTEDGRRLTKSQTVFNGALLNADLDLSIVSHTAFGADGKPQRMEFEIASGGRINLVTAEFGPESVTASSSMDGRETRKVLPLPTDAPILDDPAVEITSGGALALARSYYTFDPNTLALVKVRTEPKGTEKVSVKGIQIDAQRIEIIDPRATLSYYVTSKGDFVKATGPFGMEMIPESEIEARALPAAGARADLAFASAIPTDKPIPQADRTKKLKLRVKGFDLGRMPSDSHQTVKRDGDAWIVEVHPVAPPVQVDVPAAAPTPAEFLAADLRIPADSKRFKELARELVGNEKSRVQAAEKVRQFVFESIRANAGIGVMRDADDILTTKEGVCRDHAVLMATLLRAAEIPTKLASGIVYADGKFFYHAWVEVWDGANWVGFDSTRPLDRLSATHIKIAQGTVRDAFTSFLLEGAEIEVLDSSD